MSVLEIIAAVVGTLVFVLVLLLIQTVRISKPRRRVVKRKAPLLTKVAVTTPVKLKTVPIPTGAQYSTFANSAM